MSKSNNNYEKHLDKVLKDPELAIEYLNVALSEQQEDPTLFIRALKNVAQAWELDLKKEDVLDQHSLLDSLGLKLAIVKKPEAA
ncbi:MAG: hypothetical protein WAQ98_22670 [Blastocatellia bacterium]